MIRAGKCCREEYERFTSRWETAQRRCTRQNKQHKEKHKRRDLGLLCGRCAVRGTDNTTTRTDTKVKSKHNKQKSDVVEDNVGNNNEDDDFADDDDGDVDDV